MYRTKSVSRLLIQAALISFACTGSGGAQSLDDQKKQLEIEQMELNKQKTMAELIKGSAQTTAGSATLAAVDQSAEGLMLSRLVQERTALAIVEGLGTPDGSTISIVFGEQPVSTADYLAIKRGIAALEENLANANKMAFDTYGDPNVPDTTEPGEPGEASVEYAAAMTIPLALTAVTTVASLLRVNTNVTGAALLTPNEQYRAILTQELRRAHWKVDPPRALVAKTDKADRLLQDAKVQRDLAGKYYQIYLKSVAKAKDGKVANLPDREVIVGKALETALGDYATLFKALYTPVNGVLPATVIEEQIGLLDPKVPRRILYIQYHKAGLTSITRQGTFTGIFGLPAHVSASHVVEYAMQGGADGGKYDTVRYDTPLLRVTGVKKWVEAASRKPGDSSGSKAAQARVQGGGQVTGH